VLNAELRNSTTQFDYEAGIVKNRRTDLLQIALPIFPQASRNGTQRDNGEPSTSASCDLASQTISLQNRKLTASGTFHSSKVDQHAHEHSA
jgi:hypothetical protein